MIGLIQRVRHAEVMVAGQRVGSIGAGLLAFVAVEQDDGEVEAERLLDRLLGYRVFADSEGKMNHSLQDVCGGLLLVPQFTLAADTYKGMRPSFNSAAPPEQGRSLFETLVTRARVRYPKVEAGCFGTDMQVSLTNDGPVTFWLRAGR